MVGCRETRIRFFMDYVPLLLFHRLSRFKFGNFLSKFLNLLNFFSSSLCFVVDYVVAISLSFPNIFKMAINIISLRVICSTRTIIYSSRNFEPESIKITPVK